MIPFALLSAEILPLLLGIGLWLMTCLAVALSRPRPGS